MCSDGQCHINLFDDALWRRKMFLCKANFCLTMFSNYSPTKKKAIISLLCIVKFVISIFFTISVVELDAIWSKMCFWHHLCFGSWVWILTEEAIFSWINWHCVVVIIEDTWMSQVEIGPTYPIAGYWIRPSELAEGVSSGSVPNCYSCCQSLVCLLPWL